MKNFSTPSLCAARGFRLRVLVPRVTLMACASLLMLAATAPAQNPPASNASSVPVPAAPDINILILALDDLSAPPAPAPFVPAIPPAPAPIAPADGGAAGVGVITPTSAILSPPQWRAWAQKKTKAQKRAEQEAADKKIFNLDPEPMTVIPARPVRPGVVLSPDAPPATGPVLGAPPVVGVLPASPAINLAPPGRSQLMALSLRRALAAKGYQDVQVSTLETSTISRAIGEGRLSQRVLDELKRSLSQISTAPDASALIVAGRAASRIGQATGYRAVVAFYVGAPATVGVVGAGVAPGETTQRAGVNMVVADAQRESVEPLQFDATGPNENVWRETGGGTGAGLLDQTLRDWPATSSAGRATLATIHYNTAKSAFDRGDLARATDEINQALSLDGSRAQFYVARGDILRNSDAGAAANSYRHATEINAQDGETWAKIAGAYAYAQTPNWPAVLDAGKKALALNYDSAALRVAMATAQYGRADLFRKADYANRAEDAEADARTHLDRALQLAPDDPSAVRLLASTLIAKNRYAEAVRTLDRIAPRYPNDITIQLQYAQALGSQPGREEDAFAAYGRVWKLAGQKTVVVDASTYRTLASGFDQRLYNLGKVATQLSTGVASGAVLQDSAVLQLTKLKEEMDAAQATINAMQPSSAIGATAITSRVFAADLMDQSLQLYQNYLETGQDIYRVNGLDLYRQAVAQLNTARTTQ